MQTSQTYLKITNPMTHPYYQTPSSIGKPILDLFLGESDYKEDCIHTIWHLERVRPQITFNLLNVIKYLWRLGQKDPDYRSDLNKAIEYLTWELTEAENLRKYEMLIDARIIELLDISMAKCQDILSACNNLLVEANDRQKQV